LVHFITDNTVTVRWWPVSETDWFPLVAMSQGGLQEEKPTYVLCQSQKVGFKKKQEVYLPQ